MTVAPGGYVWWYVDALSEDGRHGLTLIAFIGSVFSPYYAWSGRRDPENHCSVNVALYGAAGRRWAMTERGRTALTRDAATLSIGPSCLHWNGDSLSLRFSEVGAPLPRRIRGSLRLHPHALPGRTFALDADHAHRWTPLAPRASVEVTLEKPNCAWRGTAYFDTNAGDAPLEDDFVAWDWSRVHRGQDTLLFYDVARRDGGETALALRLDRSGGLEPVAAPPQIDLPAGVWRVPRRPRADPDAPPWRAEFLEDTPFYTRSLLRGDVQGAPAEAVHESLSLNRLRSPLVRAMLPFRMPRSLR